MNNDLISRSELTKELRERLVACNDWEEKAKDKETRIRANAVKTFICEMFMLLKEIPTVEQKEFEQVLQPITVDVSKVDIEKIKEELNNSFNTVTTEQLFSDCERLHVEPEPVSERQKRALAIVDALTEKRLINVMERGCLRRSILLKPERPQGESKTVQDCIIAYGDGFESARRLFERPHGEWISAEAELPEDMQRVLIWFEYYRYGDFNCMYQTYGFGYVCDGKWSPFINGETGWQDYKIIAWQPLPEPYKKGEEE